VYNACIGQLRTINVKQRYSFGRPFTRSVRRTNNYLCLQHHRSPTHTAYVCPCQGWWNERGPGKTIHQNYVCASWSLHMKQFRILFLFVGSTSWPHIVDSTDQYCLLLHWPAHADCQTGVYDAIKGTASKIRRRVCGGVGVGVGVGCSVQPRTTGKLSGRVMAVVKLKSAPSYTNGDHRKVNGSLEAADVAALHWPLVDNNFVY
jgi:hypothetical protein